MASKSVLNISGLVSMPVTWLHVLLLGVRVQETFAIR